MQPVAEPILKWAGGKRQLLPKLKSYIPTSYGRYVEPMIGGGALFFALGPHRAVISDTNPELINLYRAIVSDMDGVVAQYEQWPFCEQTFYDLRKLSFDNLSPVEAAARTIYLNRACYNGLYRVNRKGQFNVPWGKYKRPYKIDQVKLTQARQALARAEILLGDYRSVARSVAGDRDFVFFDPPYVPVGPYSDFKRYTPTQFNNGDHMQMASLVHELVGRGCYVVITNSNHPLVHDLYRSYHIEVVPTRRNVNSRANGRFGEDVIIYAKGS